MKKNVLYSLAALSALPMGANAADIYVPANKSISLAETVAGVTYDNAVFHSDGSKVTIEVVANGDLYQGKYLLKATIANEGSSNALTVKYSVGGGEFVASTVNALKTGVELSVSSISKSRIVLTVEDANAQKAPFTVGNISLDLRFDFDAVYTRLNTIYNTYLSAEANGPINGFTHFADVTASGQSQTNGKRLSDILTAAQDWADDTETANYSQKNQNYQTYVEQKLYGLFKNGTYSEADADWNKLQLVKSYNTAAMQLLADIKVAENAGRSAAALNSGNGYNDLWAALKEVYTPAVMQGNQVETPANGDEGVTEDGTLRQEINGIDNAAVGRDDLVTTMDNLRTQVKNIKAEIDALDQAFTNSIDSENPLNTQVQDYTEKSFVQSTTSYNELVADVAKVKGNFAGYTADQEAYATLSDEVTALAEEVGELTAGEDVSIANLQEINADLQAIQTALSTYNEEMGTMNQNYSYYSQTANPTTHAKSIADIEAMITDLNGEEGKIATMKTAYASTSQADKDAVQAVGMKTGALTGELAAANTAIGNIDEIKDGEELIYKASNYADYDAIEAAIEKITTDAGAVEHATDYVAENNAENTPKSKFMYVYDEATYNEAWDKGYFKKYYEANPNEDIDNNDPRGHSFTAALQSAKTSNHHTWPWVVIGFDNYTGTVEFKYNDAEVFSWDVTNKVYGMVSVPLVEDMGLSEFSGWDDNGNYDSTKPATFDPSKLTITLVVTGTQVVEDYDHAVKRIQADIAAYQQLAETSQETFAGEWEKYTGLVDKFEADLAEVGGDDYDYDYTAEKAEIAAEIATVKATLTTAASTTNKGEAHKAVVDAIDIDDAIADIEAAIEETKYMVAAAKTNAEQQRQRTEARGAVDLILATFSIDDLNTAYGSETAQGVTAGSQVGSRLTEKYKYWKGIYDELNVKYEAASKMDVAEAIEAYQELKAKVGADNDFTDLQTALLTTVFEGYEGTEEGQKGLIYALAQHKQGIEANIEAKATAYAALGYDENGDYDEAMGNSLAHELWQKAEEAKTAVNAGVDTNPTDQQKFITADDKAKAVTETTGLIDTRVDAIKEQIAALKEKVDAAYGEEKLGNYWTTDHQVKGATEKAYTTEVETLKGLADALLTRTNEWINATDLHNRQASAKTAAQTALQTVQTALSSADLTTAYEHYVGKSNTYWGYVDAISVLEVNDNIITNNAEWTDTNNSEKGKIATIAGYTEDIYGLTALAQTNKTQYTTIYSGDNSTYKTVEGELTELNTFIAGQQDTPAKTELTAAYNAQVEALSNAEASIKANYAEGNYEEGAASTEYGTDEEALTNISNAITQARGEFDDTYSSEVAEQNVGNKAAMDALLAGCQTNMQNAQEVLAVYKAMTLTFDELTAVTDYEAQLPSFSSMLTISSSIEQHVNACNTANKLYQEEEPSWEEDKASIDAIATKLATFYEKVAACNTDLSSQWTAKDKDIETVKTELETFDKRAVDDVNAKTAAAEALLTAGNGAQTALATANADLDGEKAWAEQATKVTAIVGAANTLATSIANYDNDETGYDKLVDEAKELAAETDIKKKAEDWRKDNVEPVQEDLNEGKFFKDNEDLLKDMNLTKTETVNNVEKTRKEILLDLFDEAIGTTTDNSIGKLDQAIDAEDEFYTNYTTLMDKYDALVLTTTAIESKIQEWTTDDALYANIQATVDEYVKLTPDGELDEAIETPLLNKQYLTEKALIKGSLVEDNEEVTTAYSNLKRAIKNFGKAEYTSVEAVTTAYTGSQATWAAAMITAVTQEKAAIAAAKEKLNDLFEGDYSAVKPDFSQAASVQSRINAIDATSNEFATLKGYEQEIVDLNVLMLNVINTGGADVYADLKQKAAGLEISSQDVKDFLDYKFGTDTHATDVKAKQTELAAKKEAIVAAINELNADFNGEQPKYTVDNILYYKDDVVRIIGDENGGLVKDIADLTEAVTEIGSVDGMTPAEALADYKERKAANEEAKNEIDAAISAVEAELRAAVTEYPEIEDGIVIAFDNLQTDYANLDLVEKDNEGNYVKKDSYDTTDLSNDIKEALYDARKTELTDYITEEQLNNIVSRVTAAINAKGLIGLAKKNLLAQADEYNETYTNENAKITDTLTKEVKDSIREALETLAGQVDDLIESVASYSQPGDLTGTGSVGSTDFTRLKNIILGKNTMDDYDVTLENCDLNGDGKVGIGDLVILNNLQLGLNPDGTEPNARALNGGESLSTETTVTSENTRRIAISLDNSREYVAFQIDMVLPEGMTLVGESLTDRARLQRLASNDLADGTHRIISVPVLNTTFKGNEGAMLYIDVETSASYMGGDVELKSVVFTDALGQETEFSIASETTGIMDTLKSAAQTAKEAIYSVGGKMRDGLKKGINIIRRADGSTEKVIKK